MMVWTLNLGGLTFEYVTMLVLKHEDLLWMLATKHAILFCVWVAVELLAYLGRISEQPCGQPEVPSYFSHTSEISISRTAACRAACRRSSTHVSTCKIINAGGLVSWPLPVEICETATATRFGGSRMAHDRVDKKSGSILNPGSVEQKHVFRTIYLSVRASYHSRDTSRITTATRWPVQ